MIEPIKNPYIPEEFNSSLNSCCAGAPSSEIPKAWETRYTDVKLTRANLFRDDITGAYTPQGGCVHNGYIYRAMVKEDDEPAIIQKIRISDNKIVAEVDNSPYGHCNDMFVKDGRLCVLHSSSTNIVYELDAETLEFLAVSQMGPIRWGQAYNETDKLEVIGNVGSAYFSVYNNGKFMYRIKPANPFSGMVRQGIFCTDNYIGVSLDNEYGAVIGNCSGSRIMFYTWNGMFIKSVHIPISEIEWSDYADGNLYIGTYEGRDPNDVKSGKIYIIPFDLYPEQTVITGRPTDVSGGLNNLQRLPEGTPVRLWDGEQATGVITLATLSTRLRIDEDGPFRYLLFEFDGANAGTFAWFPKNNGVVALREFDVTAAEKDSVIRFRESRLIFNAGAQTFTIDTSFVEELKKTASTDAISITKNPSGVDGITIRSIWGII